MAVLEVQTMGPVAAVAAGGERVAFPTRKSAALCAYMAVERAREHSRETLVALLWPDAPVPQGRANLRKTLSRLRHALPEAARGLLRANADSVALSGEGLVCDVDRLKIALESGDPEALGQAGGLYQGPFLDGLQVGSEAFDDWCDGWRRWCEESAQRALRWLLRHRVAAGQLDAAMAAASRLLAFDPLQETVHQTLIRLYLQQGRHGAALTQYQQCKDLLAAELGIEPAPETLALKAEIHRAVPAAPSLNGQTAAKGRAWPPAPGRPIEVVAGPAGLPSLAVLPFVDLSEDARSGHLAVGLTEAIITALTRFRSLQVIAPHSAFAFGAAELPSERAGALLGVAYRLEGSLHQKAGRLLAHARLIDNDSHRHLWAERFELAEADFPSLEAALTQPIVSTLVGRIEGERLASMSQKQPRDWHADDYWLKGRAALRRVDLRAVVRARAYFKRAIEIAPRFANAYVGLAMADVRSWSHFNWQPMASVSLSAYRNARRAVEIDEADYQAHCILGFTQMLRRNFDAAERHLQRALALNPNDAQTLAHACCVFALLGRGEQGVRTGRLALQLDPFHPDWYVGSLGCSLFASGQFDAAIEALAPVPEALCDSPAYLAASYALSGRRSEAAEQVARILRLYRARQSRGLIGPRAGCLEWLLDINPFRRDQDRDRFVEGLRLAGLTDRLTL